MASEPEQSGGGTADGASPPNVSASDSIHETLLNHTAAAILLVRDDKIVYANPTAHKIAQDPEKSLIGTSIYDLFHPDSKKRIVETCRDLFNNIELVDAIELKLPMTDGNTRWMECNPTLISVQGQPTALISLTDITSRKQLDLAREELQAILLTAIEQSPAGIMVIDCPQMIIRSANQKAIHLRTQDNNNFNPIGSSLQDCFNHCNFRRRNGELYSLETCPLFRAVKNGESVHNEEVFVEQSDGTRKCVLAHAEAVRNEAGEIIAGVIITSDITERNLAQQSIRLLVTELQDVKASLLKQNRELLEVEARISASLNQYTDLYDNAPVGYLTLSNRGIILRANSTARTIFKFSNDVLLRSSSLQLVVKRHRRKIVEMFQAVAEEKKRLSCEVELNSNEGERKFIHLECVPTTSSDGEPLVRAAVIDVSQQMRAEIKLAQSEQRYRMIVENPLSIVAVIDDNYSITFASQGLCRTVDYPYRELIGMDFRKMLTDEQRDMIADRYIRRRKGEEVPSQYGIDLIARNGKIRSTIANIFLATGPNGELQTIVNMIDITDRKDA